MEMELVAEFEVEAAVDALLASMHQGTLLCAHMHPQAEILKILYKHKEKKHYQWHSQERPRAPLLTSLPSENQHACWTIMIITKMISFV